MVATFGGRTQDEATRYMIQSAAASHGELTDYNPNAVIRTFFEAVALMCERLEEEALAEVAEGIDTAAYRAFGFPQRLATQAAGVILLTRTDTTQEQTIAAGTLVRVPATTRQYATVQAVTLDAGIAAATVPIVAVLPGTFYNTPIGTISQWVIAPSGAAITPSNPSAITSGTDDETDEERRVRFGEYMASIHRATPFAMEYGAKLAVVTDPNGIPIERVREAQVRDRYALTNCWIWNGQGANVATTPEQAPVDVLGGGASAALVAWAQRVIDGYRHPATGAPVEGYKAAGIVVNVKAATLRVQPVNAIIYVQSGYALADIAESIRAAIRATFARQRVGAPLLRLNDLRQAIGLTRGVIDHALLNPTTDVGGGDGIVIVPGSIGLIQG